MSHENIPNEILQKGKELRANLLPAKSKHAYDKVYVAFKQWKSKKRVNEVTEDVILAYLDTRSQKLCPASLWPEYSMLKATLKAKDNIDIGKFGSVVPFLKNLNVGYRSKKSKVLSRQEIQTFLEEADDTEYLFMKVALVFGIAGACRKGELRNMNYRDIQDCGDVLNVIIPDTKTHKERRFTILNDGFGIKPIDLYRRYVALRPKDNVPPNFFLHYLNGKCTRQVVGINMFGEIPKKIAMFLKLENPTKYTGHAFRRSAATLFANAGGDITSLKRYGGWESSKIAESYIEESLEERVKIARKVFSNGRDVNISNQNWNDNANVEVSNHNPLPESGNCSNDADVRASSNGNSLSRSGNFYFLNCNFY